MGLIRATWKNLETLSQPALGLSWIPVIRFHIHEVGSIFHRLSFDFTLAGTPFDSRKLPGSSFSSQLTLLPSVIFPSAFLSHFSLSRWLYSIIPFTIKCPLSLLMPFLHSLTPSRTILNITFRTFWACVVDSVHSLSQL
jgi:hypothetical protein